jgi:hypothetical protein
LMGESGCRAVVVGDVVVRRGCRPRLVAAQPMARPAMAIAAGSPEAGRDVG